MSEAWLAALHTKLSRILEGEVEPLFTGDVRLTLVARTPWLEDGGVLITNDDPEEAIAEIRRLASRPPEIDGQAGR